ncbi:JmjC domain, hydroxylase-domain-containing protein [Mycotypha africana]|uniref:JmjC domain, hydroxylase-domain-containing protein n=1 Tax=Mycotypha africana TaxID=64632 RepID=UPI002301C509|nr:JmjC domain, hydroxylase-domain-containing protein [Mycotypha africana]KAI8977230.1 JmjC domain, hydroxylase-domain-containing protein [Mycotypha africana]
MTLNLKPVGYYDQENGGQVPIFKPTFEEFKDFRVFTQSIDHYGRKAGIVKVIPPPEWRKDVFESCAEKIDEITITKPITQHILGSRGLFLQTNVEKRKKFKVEEWFSLCQRAENRPPKINRTKSTPKMNLAATAIKTDRKHKIDQIASHNAIATSMFIDNSQDARFPIDYVSETCHLSVDQYKEYERNYWRNITFNQPLYGADMSGTLFDTTIEHWNPNNLDNLLNTMKETLPGVNKPYLYFGMWKATFPWHVEDLDLYSINYIHFGAPKQWYTIPTSSYQKFEKFMQNTFYQHYKGCHEFLRHKTFIVSPKVLEENNIPFQRCVQQPGEFMITYPYGYHAGYNLDFNCAESVNFATEAWLDIGKRAKRCTCLDDDSVRIDVTSLFGRQHDEEENSTYDISHSNKPSSASRRSKDMNRKKRKLMMDNSSINSTLCKLCSSNNKTLPLLQLADNVIDKVHQLCAEAIPEIHIKGNVVYGIDRIPKSRWNLTCTICKQKTGACIQCCIGKCYRAVHATCVLNTNGTMERLSNRDLLSQHSLYNTYCPLHDPKRIAERRIEQEYAFEELSKKFQANRDIYIKWTGGDYEKGIIEECIPDKKMCRVLLTDGLVRKIRWTYLSFDPPQSTLNAT